MTMISEGKERESKPTTRLTNQTFFQINGGPSRLKLSNNLRVTNSDVFT
jgi:hypothetical protein